MVPVHFTLRIWLCKLKVWSLETIVIKVIWNPPADSDHRNKSLRITHGSALVRKKNRLKHFKLPRAKLYLTDTRKQLFTRLRAPCVQIRTYLGRPVGENKAQLCMASAHQVSMFPSDHPLPSLWEAIHSPQRGHQEQRRNSSQVNFAFGWGYMQEHRQIIASYTAEGKRNNYEIINCLYILGEGCGPTSTSPSMVES